MAANVEGAVSHLPAHLSIRSKIIAGFAVVLICTIGLGLFSTQRLDAVNGNAQDIRDNYLPGTRILGRLAQVSERLRSNRGSLLLATTDVQRTQYGSTIKQQAALYARAREDYQPLVSAGDEQRLTDAFDAAWKRYLEISDATAGLMAQGKRDDAIALFLGEGAKAIATFRDALQADIDLNVLEGTQAADAGARTRRIGASLDPGSAGSRRSALRRHRLDHHSRYFLPDQCDGGGDAPAGRR